ncbi:putative Zinc metalloproteinase nas-14, partial [Hypsibius exemplaris]
CGSSQVGKKGGVQNVYLSVADDRDCVSKGIIQHELMHVVGFFHEQSRSDRNDFVDINKNNLDPEDFQRNFLDWSAAEVTAFGFPYDFGSIMHYSTVAFSKDDNSWTIRPKKKWAQYETVMGQRNSLSQIDIGKINAMYKCPERGGAKPNQPLPPPPSPPTRASIQPTKLFSSSSFITGPDYGNDDETTTAGPPVRPSVRSTRRTTRPSVPATEPPPDDDEDVENPETQAPTQRTTRPRRITPRPTVPFIDNGGDISNVWPSYLQPGPRRTCEDAVISGQDCPHLHDLHRQWRVHLEATVSQHPNRILRSRSWQPRDPAKTSLTIGLSCTRCHTPCSGPRTNWNGPVSSPSRRPASYSPTIRPRRRRTSVSELKKGTQTCTHCTWLGKTAGHDERTCRWKK